MIQDIIYFIEDGGQYIEELFEPTPIKIEALKIGCCAALPIALGILVFIPTVIISTKVMFICCVLFTFVVFFIFRYHELINRNPLIEPSPSEESSISADIDIDHWENWEYLEQIARANNQEGCET